MRGHHLLSNMSTITISIEVVNLKERKSLKFNSEVAVTLEQLKTKVMNDFKGGSGESVFDNVVSTLGYVNKEGNYIEINTDEDLRIAGDSCAEKQLLKIFLNHHGMGFLIYLFI